jgi:hypothetical protein
MYTSLELRSNGRKYSLQSFCTDSSLRKFKTKLKEQGKDFLGVSWNKENSFIPFCTNHFEPWAAGKYKHLLHTNL